MYYLIDRAVSEFTKSPNTDWYNQLGNLASEWAEFCVYSEKPI